MYEGVIASSPFAPLIARFGDRLTHWRDASTASWSHDGRTATVALGPDGSLEATFADRPTPMPPGRATRLPSMERAGTRSRAAGVRDSSTTSLPSFLASASRVSFSRALMRSQAASHRRGELGYSAIMDRRVVFSLLGTATFALRA